MTLPLLALVLVPVFKMVSQGAPNAGGILLAAGALLALIVAAIVFAVIGKLTTDFVVPIMFLTNAIMIWLEWNTKFRWHAVVSFLCISAATVVGWFLIIPVNKTIAAGVEESRLTGLFQVWMSLNDILWVIITIMWITLMIYFLMKPSLSDRR